jgi:hypothetical protein
MSRIVALLLAAVAVAAGFFAWHQYSEASTLRDRIAALEQERDDARKAETQAKRSITPLREQNAELKKERDTARVELDQARKQTTATKPAGDATAEAKPPVVASGGGFKDMAKMFQTEEGKKMMKAQMSMITKMQYRDLAGFLKLSPQESEQVMALLEDRQTAIAGDPWALMADGELDEKKMTEIEARSKATKAEFDQKLKGLLGDEKFKQMEEYDKGAGARMMMGQLEQSLGASGTNLQPDQRNQLLQIMLDERKNSPPSPFDETGADAARNWKAMMDDTAIDRWMTQESEYHRRVLQNAPKVLAPEQVIELQKAFTQAMEMQKFGMKMGREMMKGAAAKEPPK